MDILYAWGRVLAVRTHYADFIGITVKIDRQAGIPFSFPSGHAICTIDKGADYLPGRGDYVRLMVGIPAGNGIIVTPAPENEYFCDNCHELFESEWTEEEAQVEAKRTWTPEQLAGDMAVVCENCYQRLVGSAARLN